MRRLLAGPARRAAPALLRPRPRHGLAAGGPAAGPRALGGAGVRPPGGRVPAPPGPWGPQRRHGGGGGAGQPFESLALSEGTLRALREVLRHDAMSGVQAQVLPEVLAKSCDFVVRAHTGTGKTLAFLIPAVESLLASPHSGVSALVVAPTRELACQIGKQAEALLAMHHMNAVTLIGGSSTRQDHIMIRRKKPRLVVGTPGRLLEHFERTFLFPTLFEGLSTLVLDEADRLLSLGFLKEVKEIIAYLPKKRCSMLFSATISQDVLDVASKTCRGNYSYIDCIGEEQAPTASMVEQSYVVFPGHECLAVLYNLLMDEMARNRYSYKVLAFFPTARMVAFMAQFFRQQLHVGVYELHRRRDAAARSGTSARFQEDRCGILFSSDVSARGLDYPDVTLVLQFGAPPTREMYIHRVGRTARAGKAGRAVLVLGEAERGFLRAVEDLPLRPHEGADRLRRVNELVVRATTSWLASASLRASAAAAFASLLVHYKATHRVLHMADDQVIQAASDVLLGCGLVDQPVISKRLAVMLGLENHPKIQCATRLGEEEGLESVGNVNSAASPRLPGTSHEVSEGKRRRASWRG